MHKNHLETTILLFFKTKEVVYIQKDFLGSE